MGAGKGYRKISACRRRRIEHSDEQPNNRFSAGISIPSQSRRGFTGLTDRTDLALRTQRSPPLPLDRRAVSRPEHAAQAAINGRIAMGGTDQPAAPIPKNTCRFKKRYSQ